MRGVIIVFIYYPATISTGLPRRLAPHAHTRERLVARTCTCTHTLCTRTCHPCTSCHEKLCSVGCVCCPKIAPRARTKPRGHSCIASLLIFRAGRSTTLLHTCRLWCRRRRLDLGQGRRRRRRRKGRERASAEGVEGGKWQGGWDRMWCMCGGMGVSVCRDARTQTCVCFHSMSWRGGRWGGEAERRDVVGPMHVQLHISAGTCISTCMHGLIRQGTKAQTCTDRPG